MKIFVSFAFDDLPIARAFCIGINNAFQGAVEAVYSSDFLEPGIDWKKSIRGNLRDSNAIVTLLTDNSINRGWIYIEWSAFWMDERPIFILKKNDLKMDQIIKPMQDTQVSNMTDVEAIKALLGKIAKLAKMDKIPYSDAEIIVHAIKSAELEVIARSMDAYLDPAKAFPKSDSAKYKVAEYFRETEKYSDLRRICGEIRDDAYIFQISVELINDGIDEVVADIASLMKRPTRVASMAEILVERKQHETQLFADLLERIADDEQSVLTSLFKISFRDDATRDRMFTIFFRHFNNLPEIRKIGMHLADLDEDDDKRMLRLLERFKGANYAELRKLMEALYDRGKSEKSYFREMLTVLKADAPRMYQLLVNATGVS